MPLHWKDRAVLAVLLLVAIFIGLSGHNLRQPGIQADEALFANGIYRTDHVPGFAWVFGHRLPLMVMPYVGALKSWIYAPVFAVFAPDAASIRWPVILLGALTLWLTYRLLAKAVSARAGVIAVCLLAADPLYVFLTRCDWGPAALQHLLAVSAGLAIVSGRYGLAAFLAGLALWDKAVFVWTLAGFAVAALALYPREVRGVLTTRKAVGILAAFAAGAYPLLRYNLKYSGDTFHQTASFVPGEIPHKALYLVHSLAGDGLFGYLTPEFGGGLRTNLTVPLLFATLAALPWLYRRSWHRPVLFFLLLPLVAWLWMASMHSAGASTHHVVLLWPWPHCAIAIALAQLPLRAAAPVVLLAVGLNIGVTANYHSMLSRSTADPPWSDAIYPLANYLESAPPGEVYITDWGILENLNLLTAGRLNLYPPDLAVPTARGLYVMHAPPRRYLPAPPMLSSRDPALQSVATISDSSGHPVYEVLQYCPLAVGND